ncbi:unnamed protein product [Ambrosiozyma monospora]|uniref:Unnamed protein product n=1 Tax=Ambrosiozyma monospora TaxID=43982 RepID=A0ACB5SYT8_AMBMO|nr:unnamed protein product [Ambrosiozyma monospora]
MAETPDKTTTKSKIEQVVKDEDKKEYSGVTAVLLTVDDIKQLIQNIIEAEGIDEKDAFFKKWNVDQWNQLAAFSIKQSELEKIYPNDEEERPPVITHARRQRKRVGIFIPTFGLGSGGTRRWLGKQIKSLRNIKKGGDFTDVSKVGKQRPYIQSADGTKEWQEMANNLDCDPYRMEIVRGYIENALKEKDLEPDTRTRAILMVS